MKNYLSKYLVLGIIGMIFAGGCGLFRTSEPMKKYNAVYVGWIDLGEENYAAYGYGTKDAWAEEIRSQNIDSLQAYTRKYMHNWNVTGAESKTAVAPGDPNTIVVKFSNVVLTPGTDQLRCTMSFYDGASGKMIKSVNEEPSSVSNNPNSGYASKSFSGKLSNEMYNMANDIKHALTN